MLPLPTLTMCFKAAREQRMSAEGRQCLSDQTIGKCRLRDVTRYKARTQLARERRAGGLIAARQHHASTRFGHMFSNGVTDSRGRTRDQHGFARQFPQDFLLTGRAG